MDEKETGRVEAFSDDIVLPSRTKRKSRQEEPSRETARAEDAV